MPANQSKAPELSKEELAETNEVFETLGLSTQAERDAFQFRHLADEERHDDVKFVGWISREDFERHARSSGVQNLIQSARKSWMERYGADPAAARVTRVNNSG